MSIHVGKTAKHLREKLGLSQREAAERLGITAVHLCNIENNRSAPSQELIDRYRQLWGVDLYVLAWCLHGDVDRLPKSMREAASRLAKGWEQQLRSVVD